MPYRHITLKITVFFLVVVSMPSESLAAELPAVRIVMDEPLNFVSPDELGGVRLEVVSSSDDGRIRLEAGLSDGYAEEPASFSIRRAIQLRAGRPIEVPIPERLIGDRLGVRYVHYRLYGGDSNTPLVRGVTQFAVFEPVGATPGVNPGEFIIANHGPSGRPNADPALQAKLMRAAAITGAETLRFSTPWRDIERVQGQPDWQGVDRVYDLADRYGMELQLLIAYGGARWTKSEETLQRINEAGIVGNQWPAPTYPPRADLWEKWTRDIVERYGDRTRLYEIWNEPDLPFFKGTADEYVELLRASSRAIRSGDPDGIVLTGGFADLEHPKVNLEVIRKTLTDGYDDFDWFNYHRHQTAEGLRTGVENKLLPLMRELDADDKPLYFSETSMGRPDDREFEMAVEYPKRVAYLWSIGAKAWTAFTLWQPSVVRGHQMLNPDFTPRPAYVGFNEVVRQLRGRRYVQELDLGEGRYGYAFRGKGHFSGVGDNSWVFVAWTEDSTLSESAVPIRLGPDATAARIDLMGNRQEVPLSDGVASMKIGYHPTYFVAESVTSEPGLLPPLLEYVGTPLMLLPGRDLALSLKVRNPFGERVAVELTPVDQAGLTGSLDRPSLRLPVGGEEDVTLNAQLAEGSEVPKYISVQADTELMSSRVDVPLVLPTPSPGGSFDSMAYRVAEFSLDRSEQVVNNNDIFPGTQHLTWEGPTDLSSAAWVGEEDSSLLLRFDVSDDVHRQPFSGGQIWQGDAVQAAVAVPGVSEYLEFGVARRDDGTPVAHVWQSPAGVGAEQARDMIQVETEDIFGGVRYLVRVPFEAAGLTGEDLIRGLRFTYLVQDLDDPADDAVREGWIELTPGIAQGKDVSTFAWLVVRSED
ncbi:MAG: hypothetical protein AAGG38_01800 [Planctomycetota bacterium]